MASPFTPATIPSSGGGGSFAAISDSTLVSAGTFDFQSIAGTYAHLLIVWQIRATQNAAAVNGAIRFNNDSGSNYMYEELNATDTPPSSGGTGLTAAGKFGIVGGTSLATNLAAAGTIWIPNYAGTAFFKQWLGSSGVALGTAAANQVTQNAWGTWQSASAITRVTLLPGTGTTFEAGSRATLYGVAAS